MSVKYYFLYLNLYSNNVYLFSKITVRIMELLRFFMQRGYGIVSEILRISQEYGAPSCEKAKLVEIIRLLIPAGKKPLVVHNE